MYIIPTNFITVSKLYYYEQIIHHNQYIIMFFKAVTMFNFIIATLFGSHTFSTYRTNSSSLKYVNRLVIWLGNSTLLLYFGEWSSRVEFLAGAVIRYNLMKQECLPMVFMGVFSTMSFSELWTKDINLIRVWNRGPSVSAHWHIRLI